MTTPSPTDLISADMSAPVIAIDGPTASGKGTVAQKIALALGWHYLDSGALYRLVALKATHEGVFELGGVQVQEGATNRLASIAAGLNVRFENATIWLDGDNATDAIRTELMGLRASFVASISEVRAALTERQRAFRQKPGLVADGRDMGTVIFPDATVKIFLTATAAARAQRRYKQLIDKAISANFDDLVADLEARDARDSNRLAAPLKAAPDAVLIDSTSLDADETVAAVLFHYPFQDTKADS